MFHRDFGDTFGRQSRGAYILSLTQNANALSESNTSTISLINPANSEETCMIDGDQLSNSAGNIVKEPSQVDFEHELLEIHQVIKMSSIPLFRTPEEITAELERQQREEDDEEFEDSCSEDEDGLLMNDDDVDDEFDAEEPRHETQMEIDPENREFFIGKDGETIWTNKTLQSPFGWTPARNIITHFPGAKGIAKNLKKEIDLFSLFVTEEMINILERYTNQEIERKCSKHEWLAQERYTHPTNVLEIKALIGLLFMAGELKNSGLNLQDMFSPIHGPPIFRYGMSKNRFQFLLLTLRFDDKNSRDERKANDRFAAFREFWELFLENCRAYYTPSEYVTVDETLLSFRGHCIFRMYMKNKPDKYGLKIVSLCDAKTYYFLGGIPYLGKERREIENVSKPTSYVLNLVDSLKNSNRSITTDNWFTSCELADKLTSKKLTLVGTLRKNKREIPPEFLETKGAPVMSSRFLYDPEKMMVSFTPKKNKNVILLSSMHDDGFVNEVTKKPEIIEFYNMTKGGVDVFDRLCHEKTTKRKTNRWPMRYFYGVLDFAGVNAYVLHKLNNVQDTYSSRVRGTFLKTLATDLVEPSLKVRAQNARLPKMLRLSIQHHLGEEQPQRPVQPQDTRKPRRCDVCNEGSKRKDRKGYAFCEKCGKCSCGEHKKVICRGCLNNDDSD